MTPARSQHESRRARRQSFITFVWYKCVGADGQHDAEGEEGLARSCDISEGGLGLVTSRPLPTGARLFVEITSRLGSLSLVARVTYCRPGSSAGTHHVGLDVEIVPPNDRKTLEQLLHK